MADLPKRELGRTGLQVTMLGYGAMELRGAPRARDTTEAQAETILNAVLDAGINYIDTSIDYGVSEERIGRYISHRRSEYYLASKCGCLVGAPPAVRGQRSPHVFTRDNILAGVEQSLVRMKTDYLDVVQFHISPSKQTLEENGALDAVMELKAGWQGAVHRHVRHAASPEGPHRHGRVRRLSDPLLGNGTRTRGDDRRCRRRGVGHRHPRRRREGSAAEGKQAGLQWERWQAAKLEDLLGDMTPMEFILRFTFTNPDLDTTIVGTVNPAHLRANVEILQQGPLPADLYAEAKHRLAVAGSVPQGT